MKVLITGSAGFIGFHTALKYLQTGYNVIGIDSINDYYATSLKLDRLTVSGISREDIEYNTPCYSSVWSNYKFVQLDIEDSELVMQLFAYEKFDLVIHLAAQAGVRYSIDNPRSYIQSNIVGFMNILEACRHYYKPILLYASSSSVYGMSDKPHLSVADMVDKPVSLYAATKKSNELMAHVYSHLYGIRTIGLRFFTVYGPWGRPDMAPFIFADAIWNSKPLKVFNHGNMKRDFTFISDIVEGVYKISINQWKDLYYIFNIGNSSPVKLLDFINHLEKELGKIGIKEYFDIQPGDVVDTWADISDLTRSIEYSPSTSILEGTHEFIQWYKSYYNLNNSL